MNEGMPKFRDCGHPGKKNSRGKCKECSQASRQAAGHKGGLKKGATKKRPARSLARVRRSDLGGRRKAAKADLEIQTKPPCHIRSFALEPAALLKVFKLMKFVCALVKHIPSVVLQGGQLLGAYRTGEPIKHDDDIDFFCMDEDRKQLTSVAWAKHGLSFQRVGTGHYVVSYTKGGEKLKGVRGNERTKVTWPFAEFFELSYRNASKRQKARKLAVVHSKKFFGFWPREEWNCKRTRFMTMSLNGLTCEVPVASRLQCLKHLKLNYGRKWHSEVASPLFIHRRTQKKAPAVFTSARYTLEGELQS